MTGGEAPETAPGMPPYLCPPGYAEAPAWALRTCMRCASVVAHVDAHDAWHMRVYERTGVWSALDGPTNEGNDADS